MDQRTRDVVRLQLALNREGFGPLVVDGIAGPATSAALTAYAEKISFQPHGPDASHWQVKADWLAVAASGCSYAFYKAGDGVSEEPTFKKNWVAIKDAGMIRGAYWWLHPSKDLTKQADKCFEIVGKLGQGDVGLWIDGERDDPGVDGQLDTSDDIKITDQAFETFANLIEERTGKRPAVYSYGPFLESHNIEVPSCDLAISDFRTGPPTIPKGWSKHTWHQFIGGDGRQAGIPGPCDHSRFNGSLGELRHKAGY